LIRQLPPPHPLPISPIYQVRFLCPLRQLFHADSPYHAHSPTPPSCTHRYRFAHPTAHFVLSKRGGEDRGTETGHKEHQGANANNGYCTHPLSRPPPAHDNNPSLALAPEHSERHPTQTSSELGARARTQCCRARLSGTAHHGASTPQRHTPCGLAAGTCGRRAVGRGTPTS
jgi:hypothetical protein